MFDASPQYDPYKFSYRWKLADTIFAKDKGAVFSCFSCGGGSSFGYKLAGFDVIGCNEIDRKMMAAYIANHKPKCSFLEPIQTFKLREDLPAELYNLDILDGSPPCSSYSMSGNREKDWGKEKVFREGQSKQVLDTLFFDFIYLAKKLQPKIVIAENVKGLMMGNAYQYVKRIYTAFREAGYSVRMHLLDASKMGVPQRRERVFFTAMRMDLAEKMASPERAESMGYKPWGNVNVPEIDLRFNERPVVFGEFADYQGRLIPNGVTLHLWHNRQHGDNGQDNANMRLYGKGSYFGQSYVYEDIVCPTLLSKDSSTILFSEPRYLSVQEKCSATSYPRDYDFNGLNAQYLCGMSVPPVCMAQLSTKIYGQWLKYL